MLYTVYKHTTPSNKVYIGITMQSTARRWRKDGSGYRTQRLFYNAIKSYGWDNIKHEILFRNLPEEEALKTEIELIARYKSNERKYGYNINNGGDTRAEWAKTARGKKQDTIIVGYNDKEIHFFRSQTEAEHYGFSQNVISLCLQGKRKMHKGLFWRRANKNDVLVFDTTIANPKQQKKQNRPIVAINTTTKEARIYNSTHEAEKDGFDRGNIYAILKGRKKTCHGYMFAYLATPTTEPVAGQTMQVQQGDNVVEITQVSLDNLELEAKYKKTV